MEEDIIYLEELINFAILPNTHCFIEEKEIQAIENLINRVKDLEKENNKLKQLKEKHNVRINDLCAMLDNFAYYSIPKSKIREKIEELDGQLEYYNELVKARKETDCEYYDNVANLRTRRVLQELLEDK